MALRVNDLGGPGLHPAVAAVALALSWGLGPRQPGQGPAQGRLIGLDREQIVPTTLTQPAGVAGLAVQRIGGDQDVLQVGQGGRVAVKAAISSPSTTPVWVSTSRARWS